jgi:hypothetical protein
MINPVSFSSNTLAVANASAHCMGGCSFVAFDKKDTKP